LLVQLGTSWNNLIIRTIELLIVYLKGMLVDRYRRDRIIGVGQVVAEKTYRIEYNPECYASQKRPENGFSGYFYCTVVTSP
jgi:hypothetical protein